MVAAGLEVALVEEPAIPARLGLPAATRHAHGQRRTTLVRLHDDVPGGHRHVATDVLVLPLEASRLAVGEERTHLEAHGLQPVVVVEDDHRRLAVDAGDRARDTPAFHLPGQGGKRIQDELLCELVTARMDHVAVAVGAQLVATPAHDQRLLQAREEGHALARGGQGDDEEAVLTAGVEADGGGGGIAAPPSARSHSRREDSAT